ncbi:chemotaxis protein CheB [Mycobacterium avium]|uniref:chemotaxis protein CheB n=1 Tax=Mycobacterium avium TaxID=1764 RepID=UPI00104B5C31|nr:chemotaxis protein CheB [Mycobacterium avium subsp. hominissuis]QBI66789.1 chemotaxis protein CheB [Mycobacterium avium subsp. hominissuis]
MRRRVETERVTTEADRPGVELVALVASAGGLEALTTVLRDLPRDFPAAVVVQQHLAGHDSLLATILTRQSGRPVGWAANGRAVTPGQVVICPPGKALELTPQGRCRLHGAQQHGARGADVLLTSIAGSYGPRGVAVVLSGSGRDGAAGTVAMRRAGGVVIAESPATALYPSMPIAAAQAGADLVLGIGEIAPVLADLVHGLPLPLRSPPADAPDEAYLDGGVDPDGIFARLAARFGANTPAARAELARLRAAELRRRRQELSAGVGATRETVATARRRAEESRRRALLAHRAADEASARSEQEHRDRDG